MDSKIIRIGVRVFVGVLIAVIAVCVLLAIVGPEILGRLAPVHAQGVELLLQDEGKPALGA